MKDRPVRPCPHMLSAVNQIAEGRKGGLYLWYALRHLVRCPKCQAALDAVRAYLTHVRQARLGSQTGLGESRWSEIESQVMSASEQEPT